MTNKTMLALMICIFTKLSGGSGLKSFAFLIIENLIHMVELPCLFVLMMFVIIRWVVEFLVWVIKNLAKTSTFHM